MSAYRRFVSSHWREEAICVQTDPDMFFPEGRESIVQALAVCAGCPVRRDCLKDALDNNELHGIFGGRTASQRLAMRRQHPATVAAA